MGVGSLINRENLIEMIGSAAWRSNNINSCYEGTVTLYVDAPAFQITFNLWGNGSEDKEGSCFISRWNGLSWIRVYGSTEHLDSVFSYSWTFKHNVDGGSEEDVHDCHLWKIVLTEGVGEGGSFYNIFSGGLEKVPASIYQNHFKGRKIIGVTCGIWEKGIDYASDEEFLSDKGYGVLRGTPIAVQSGTYQYICAGTA